MVNQAFEAVSGKLRYKVQSDRAFDQKSLGVFCAHGRRQFARHNVERLLDNLMADASTASFQRFLDQLFCNSAFVLIGFVEQVDENIGVDKFTAHSFRLA